MGRAGQVAGAALALAATAAAAWLAAGLRIEARPVDLLPDDAPAALDYREFLDRFGGIERLWVLVRGGADAEATIDAADALAAHLAGSAEVAEARSGLDERDEAFLLRWVLPRAPLLADLEPAAARARLDPDAVARRVAGFRERLSGPLGAAGAGWIAADPLGFAEELPLLAGGAAGNLPVDPLTGAFWSESARAALVRVTPANAALDAEAGRRMEAALAAAAAAAREEAGAPALRVDAVGGPLYAAQDERILRADLVGTVVGSVATIALILLLYFRGWRIPLALTAGVAAGVIWAGGLTAAVHRSVTVLGVAFAAILVGLGIDYGLHGAARFRSRLDAGDAPRAALRGAVRETRAAILASVATTAGAFLVLTGASFGPLRELGWIVALGIVAILAATLGVGGPLAVALARPAAPGARESATARALQAAVDAGAGLAARRPRAVLAIAALLTAAAVAGATRVEFQADLRGLRPADHPAFAAESLLLEAFDLGLESVSVVVPASDADAALDRAADVAAALRAEGVGISVVSPSDWIAGRTRARSRLDALPREAFAEGAAALRAALEENGFRVEPFAPALAVLDAIGRGEPPPPPPPAAWPDALRDLLDVEGEGRGDGGADGVERAAAALVQVETAIGAPAAPVERALAAFPGVRVASAPRLAAELRDLVAADFKRLDLYAIGAVLLLVAVSFRGRVHRMVAALVPAAAGCLWLVGACGAAGVPFDPFTVVVAPVLLGIGIDDGLHALHGAEGPDGAGSVLASVRRVGQAVALTSLTTAAGFGSLVLSSIPALRRGGLLVAAGVLLCLVATVLLLPALEAVVARRRAGDQPPGAR